jgi:uncharacterized alkaline shock family protein YloU
VSTQAGETSSPQGHGDDALASPDRPAAQDRGSLTVSDRVVERVAGYAVTLVSHATAAPRRVLGVNVGNARPEDAAHVDARVQGDTATIEATIAVRWPESVQQVATQVRQTVREQVQTITAVRVDHVDIDVVSLHVPEKKTRRVE